MLTGSGPHLTDDDLARLYAFPEGPWLRANFVATLDGGGTGHDRHTGSINTSPDRRVFALMRRLCDAVVVGAGTARIEGYRRIDRVDGHAPTLVVVSNSGHLPVGIGPQEGASGPVIFVTRKAADPAAVDAARAVLGADNVWLVGRDSVDLPVTLNRLRSHGLHHLLAEGGPSLFADLIAAGLVDDVALTLVPEMIGGDHLTRITHGRDLEVTLEPVQLLEEDGTLLGLWGVRQS